jgi:hypothetical protein
LQLSEELGGSIIHLEHSDLVIETVVERAVETNAPVQEPDGKTGEDPDPCLKGGRKKMHPR